MAAIYVLSSLPSEVDYSAQSGEVRKFTLRGVDIYDKSAGVAEAGWREKLAEFVVDYGMDVDSGMGLCAFVYPLIEDGLISTAKFRRPGIP